MFWINESMYLNPWYKKYNRYSSPEYFQTKGIPIKYNGYLIFHRVPEIWDVVKNNVCITQMAGINGAKRAIDELCQSTGEEKTG